MERLEESENQVSSPGFRFSVPTFWRRVGILLVALISVELLLFIFVVYPKTPKKIEAAFLPIFFNPAVFVPQILNEPGVECLWKQNCREGKTLQFFFDGTFIRLVKNGVYPGFNPLGAPCDTYSDAGNIFCPFSVKVFVQVECLTASCEIHDLVYRASIQNSPHSRLLAQVVSMEDLRYSSKFALSQYQRKSTKEPISKSEQGKRKTKVTRKKSKLGN